VVGPGVRIRRGDGRGGGGGDTIGLKFGISFFFSTVLSKYFLVPCMGCVLALDETWSLFARASTRQGIEILDNKGL